MRRRKVLMRAAVAVAAAAAVVVPVPPAAQASCVGPMLAVGTVLDTANPPTNGGSLAAGQDVTVSGAWFYSGCDDGGTPTAGCGAESTRQSTQAPLTKVQLVLRQGTSKWTIDTRDAAGRAERYTLTWQGRISEAVQPGPAELVAESATLPVLISS